jgi:8-oxo-dGTP pyrophosphatase MutT (NUDIX family)
MKSRPSARLIVLDPQGRVLLFRFAYRHGPLAGQSYWATPGGAVEEGETFREAATRELFEETGITATEIGEAMAEQNFPLQLTDGTWVVAEERFFLVRVNDNFVSRAGWTAAERETMTDHRWWTMEEISATGEIVYPENLKVMFAEARAVSTKRKSA